MSPFDHRLPGTSGLRQIIAFTQPQRRFLSKEERLFRTVRTIGQFFLYALSMSEYLPRWDVYVRYDPLPAAVDGFATVAEGAEGIDQVAVVNDRLEGDDLVDATAHEVDHLVNGDRFRDEEPLEKVERHGRGKKRIPYKYK